MEAYLYNFGKRDNSLGIPSRSTGTRVEVTLKAETDILNPEIELLLEGVPSYNYIELPEFNRFYFINSQTWSLGVWVLSCSEDIAGTLRIDILNTRANIMYADTNRNIVDSRIPLLADVEISEETGSIGNFVIADSPIVTLSIIGKGSFGHYLMQNSNELKYLIDGVEEGADGWQSVLDAFKQGAYGGNAAENIKSCIKLPIVPNGTGASMEQASNLVLGGYPCKSDASTYIKGLRMTQPVMSWNGNTNIPWKYTDWRRYAPYSKVFVYLPLVGVLELATNDLVNDNAINILYSINLASGDLAFQIKGTTSNRIITTGSSNIAMDGLYGNTGIDTTKALVTGGSLVASAVALGSMVASGGASAGAVAMGVSGGMASASGFINSLAGQSQGSAGIGGGAIMKLDKAVHIYCISRTLTDEPSNYAITMGYPYMKCDTVGNHAGYLQTDGAQVHSSRYTNAEIIKANNLLNGGVYIE